MTKQELIELLENYERPATQNEQTEIDNRFGMNRYDAYSWSKAYQDGDAYLYDRKEWVEFLEELKEDASQAEDEESVEAFDEQIEEFNDFHKNVEFVLSKHDDVIYF